MRKVEKIGARVVLALIFVAAFGLPVAITLGAIR